MNEHHLIRTHVLLVAPQMVCCRLSASVVWVVPRIAPDIAGRSDRGWRNPSMQHCRQHLSGPGCRDGQAQAEAA